MASSSTSSKGMDRFISDLASAKATLTFNKGAVAVVVLHLIPEQAVILDVGTWLLMTRFLCTLSLIFWSNEWVVHVGLCCKYGQGLV